eukprot:4422828-Pyramimonas_sp.AAC.1
MENAVCAGDGKVVALARDITATTPLYACRLLYAIRVWGPQVAVPAHSGSAPSRACRGSEGP